MDILPTIILSDKANSLTIHRLVKQGKASKLTARLYTTDMTDDVDKVVLRNIWTIVGLLYPKAIIDGRTAFEMKPADNGYVFIISDRVRPTTIGKYTIYPRKGAGAQAGDTPFMDNLYMPSLARKYLENMRMGHNNRCLSQVEIEEQLDKFIRNYGVTALNKLRDDASVLAPKIELVAKFDKLTQIIGALQNTRETKLVSKVGLARKAGNAYDPNREKLFYKLYEGLKSLAPVFRKPIDNFNEYLCFYEAYFSNYIEGTEFEVDEAKEIIFEGKIPASRPEDSHDIISTYETISDKAEMNRTPRNFDELVDILQHRHKLIMGGRVGAYPGIFKMQSNRAGLTIFVKPELVVGTLKRGFALYQQLDNAFARALFIKFLVTEIHPFTDGNGRLSRIMMNAEFVVNDEERVIIPTGYRYNYLSALSTLSETGESEAYIKTMAFAQEYTAKIDWRTASTAEHDLTRTNAFVKNDNKRIVLA
ncbi:Fic family protein [Deferribacterales bacterium RsTz2092]|nr:Fic family protein [Deferribacterales bacterium]